MNQAATDPDDCVHDRVLTGTTIERCVACGATWSLYPSAAEAIAACRAALRRVEREEDPA